jgi:hypothetical protein
MNPDVWLDYSPEESSTELVFLLSKHERRGKALDSQSNLQPPRKRVREPFVQREEDFGQLRKVRSRRLSAWTKQTQTKDGDDTHNRIKFSSRTVHKN